MQGSRRIAGIKKRAAAKVEARQAVARVAIGYVRVSTDEQAERGHGLEAQERAIREYAKAHGLQLVSVVADRGVSGVTDPRQREGFRQVIEMAATGAVSVAIVWKLDRLSRDLVFALNTAVDLAKDGLLLRSVTEGIETETAAGRMMLAVFAVMAEQDRRNIIERTLSGRKEKARKGGVACGAAPLGYAKDKDGGLRVVEAEAETVRRIYAMRESGMILQTIADRLNADRVPTKRGGKWRPGTVALILDNPKYKGAVEYLFRWGDGAETHVLRKGKHRAII